MPGYLGQRSVQPIVEHHPNSGRLMHFNASPGMTIRQHYAGLVLQGMMAAGAGGAHKPQETAKYAVQFADALLAELEGK